ncbi:MAG: DNA polymerase III subunit alpha [Solobacterium sp.]|nr:DNA polymerase III subunit alpha [Solobacterium sp.]
MTTHLYVRSSYTLLNSTIQIPHLVKKAKELGYDAIALSDHNVMYGTVLFHDTCLKEGIKPIIGLEIDCEYKGQIIPFLLLAQNNQGYKNLMILSSLFHERKEGCISIEELLQYKDHCFLIVYGEGGPFDSYIINENHEELSKGLKEIKETFGDCKIALSYQDTSLWKRLNHFLKNICQTIGLETIALNKIYYLKKEDAEAYRILTGIRLQKTIHDNSLQRIDGRYVLSKEEMEEIYEQDDLDRTDSIAKRCNVDLKIESSSLPTYHIQSNHSPIQYLNNLCIAGLKKRFHDNPSKEYYERLKYELQIIEKMGFANYFLIVYDYVKYAKSIGILIGPGRGSACSSLVSYCLGITQIDPVKYNLMFERFLNPERISMPDIDIDFQDNRRQEVIDYIYKRYDENHVANIITFGTLASKQVLRDVGKVLNISQRNIEIVTKMIQSNHNLYENVTGNARLKEMVKADENLHNLFKIALKLEGLQRHASTHPAGIIMSSKPIHDVIPTIREDLSGIRTSQYQAEYLERYGLIKMDFLGLRNLTIMKQVIQEIQKVDLSFQISKIPLDDENTYALFRRGDTIGVFQFESEQMKRLLMDLKPKTFDEVCACLALYRPASKDNRVTYIENKLHPEKIVYPSFELEPILKETYGVMVYQEQVMRTSIVAGGFSVGEADRIRKAITKKKPEEMLAIKDAFIKGCLKNGYKEEVANALFASMEKFDGYGFNKAHAYAYGYLAYQLAYLKANYPGYFYMALLDSVIGDEKKTSQYLSECQKRGIQILYPNVKESEYGFTYLNNTIRLPLSCVKNIGGHVSRLIIEERNKKPFVDFFDFVARATLLKINKSNLESLIHAGALDCFGQNRATLFHGLDDAINYAELIKVERNGIQTIDLGLVSKPNLMKIKESSIQIIQNEMNALGFYLGTNHIQKEKERLHIQEDSIQVIKSHNGYAKSFGLIVDLNERKTKRGELMAFLKVIDETDEIKLLIMPSLYASEKERLKEGKYILFRGKIQNNEECIVNELTYY